MRKDLGHSESCHSLWHSLAFAELLDYIKDGRGDSECPPFKLSDLALLLKHRLTKLGASDTYVHRTKLKEKIMRKIPDIRCFKQGKFVCFAFDVQISALIFGKLDNNEQQDDEAIALLKAANIIRRDMFDHGQSFNGKFAADYQTRFVPNSLMYNNIQNRKSGGCDTTQHVVSISQLIMFNGYKRCRAITSSQANQKHNHDRETALRRSKCLYSQVCKRSIGIGVVVPPLYLFVLAAIDNIDINSSSTTAMINLHGTAVSLFQCLCRNNAGMIERPHPDMNSAEHTDSLDLPEYYASIEPVSNSAMKKAEILLLEGELRDDKSVLYEELQMESQWLADTAAACSAAYHPTTKDSVIS